MSHQVTAPLVIVTDGSGRQEYLYAGALVPEYVSADRLAQLLEDGVVVDVTPAAAVEEVLLEEPALNASTADWAAYALSKGASEADIDGLKRDELVEKFGTPAA